MIILQSPCNEHFITTCAVVCCDFSEENWADTTRDRKLSNDPGRNTDCGFYKSISF